jgi:hypothetical protein
VGLATTISGTKLERPLLNSQTDKKYAFQTYQHNSAEMNKYFLVIKIVKLFIFIQIS